MKKHKKNLKEKEITKNRFYIIGSIIMILIMLITLLCINDLYIKFIEIETLGLLWTMAGFSFTIFCFFSPKLTESLIFIKNFMTVLKDDEKERYIGIKNFFKVARMEFIKNIFSLFLYLTLTFITILTCIVFVNVEMTTYSIIIINVLSAFSMMSVMLISYFVVYLGSHQFNVLNCIRHEKYDKLKEDLGLKGIFSREKLIEEFIKRREN